MLENFPYVGVSIDYLTITSQKIKRSILINTLNFNQKEETELYKKFKAQYNLNDYSNQMRLAVAVMEKFYRPILTGEIKIEDLV